MSPAKPTVIDARRVRASLDTLIAPDATEWERADEVAVVLEPTPLDRQPSAYVQVAWQDRPRSTLRQLRVRALSNASGLALRLEWPTVRPQRRISDVNVYADACAALFPADGKKADFSTMGTARQPVQGWHWRAGTDDPFVITAKGLGTVERNPVHSVEARSRWTEGTWQVVLTRPFRGEGVPIAAGARLPVAFAIWSGAARERAGLKVYSPQPHQLQLG